MVIAGAVVCPAAAAKERLVRQLGRDQGTPPQWVATIVQDPAGYLWLGTAAGLLRYDGVELQRWAPETISQGVSGIAVSEDGDRVYATVREGPIYRIRSTGAEPVPGPYNGGWRDTRRIEVDARGRLWVMVQPGPVFPQGTQGRTFAQGILFREGGTGGWEQPLASLPDHEKVRVVQRDGDGVLVGTFDGVWRFDANDRPDQVARFDPDAPEAPVDLLRMPDGALVVCTDDGRLLEYRNGQRRLIAQVPGRARAMARRGETLWVVSDGGLSAVNPAGATEVLTGAGAHPGVTVMVDREGSLWAGGSRGAFQFPEPDTVAWSAADGLARANMRLARTREGLWVTYWGGGLGLVERTRTACAAAWSCSAPASPCASAWRGRSGRPPIREPRPCTWPSRGSDRAPPTGRSASTTPARPAASAAAALPTVASGSAPSPASISSPPATSSST